MNCAQLSAQGQMRFWASCIRGNQEDTVLQPHDLLEYISKNKKMIADCKNNIKEERGKKQQIKEGNDLCTVKKN